MTATFQQAQDDMFALINTAWLTTGYPIIWPNVAADETDRGTASPWARVTVIHADGSQASLASALGTRRWNRTGNIIVQVFIPVGQGLSEGYTACKILMDALEGASTAHGVWFRRCRVREIGPDGAWYQFNVSAEFTYDEVK